MSITSVSAPSAITIAGVSTTTRASGTITVQKSAGTFYYRAYFMFTGNATAVVTNNIGAQSGSSFTTSFAPQDTAMLTSLASASALTHYIMIREYANATAYTDGTPYTSLNSATAATTISVRHTGAAMAAYNANTGGNLSCSWTEPSAHAGWRASVAFYLADSAGAVYPSGNGTVLQTGSGYSGTSGAVTTTAATLAEIRNMSIALPGLRLRCSITTGWQLTGGATYFTNNSIGNHNTVTAWTVPAIQTGTFTQERYSKIRYYNGTTWQTPSQIKVWNGTTWVDYGTAGSYNTNQIKSWYNSAWTTFTKQGSDSYNYDTAAQGLTKNPSLIDDNYLIYTYSTTTVEVNRHVGSTWGAYASHLKSTANNYGWAGTTVTGDGTADIISLYWAQDGPRWIYRLRFRTADTTNYMAAPRIIDVKFLRADGVWVLGDGTTTTDGTTWTTENTHYTKYSIPTGTYTAALTYGGYFTINLQHPQGFVGIRMRVLNDTVYKEISQSTRASGIDVDFGTVTATNTWI